MSKTCGITFKFSSTDPGFVTALVAFRGLVAWAGHKEDAPHVRNETWDLLRGSCWELAQRKQLRSPAAGHNGGVSTTGPAGPEGGSEAVSVSRGDVAWVFPFLSF